MMCPTWRRFRGKVGWWVSPLIRRLYLLYQRYAQHPGARVDGSVRSSALFLDQDKGWML